MRMVNTSLNARRADWVESGPMLSSRGARGGFALVSVILALVVISALAATAFATTFREVVNVRSTADGATGFFSAEAGLNIRGELVRTTFEGYSRPTGVSPDSEDPCEGSNLGSGDFGCIIYQFNNRTIRTYVSEDPRNNDPDDEERMITIPPGESFAGLNAIQYRYSVLAEALPPGDDRPEAILEMMFRARLVPLFQFGAFYDKDLEILPGANMSLAGPVHANGDLYTNANGATLTINGSITVSERANGTGGAFWRGRKNANQCQGTVRVNDADGSTNPDPAVPCPRRDVPQSELDAWNGRIQTGLETIIAPPPETFAPGGLYWHEADLVVALDLRNGLANAEVIVPNRAFSGDQANITTDATLTGILQACVGGAPRSYAVQAHAAVGGLPALPGTARAVEWSNSFRDRRENMGNANARNARRLMLEVDVRAVMDCLDENPDLFDGGPSTERALDDTSSGGLVWYFTVLGPYATDASSGYGVRLRNGWRLASTDGSAPQINGLTVVSNHSVFVQGNYNLNGTMGADWRPAAVLADAVHVLSNNYASQWGAHQSSTTSATTTTVQVAFMSGTQTTGGVEGVAGQGGAYNGGLENYPTLHENWGGHTLTYLGSFVSLDLPLFSNGPWGCCVYYGPPVRDWGYDTRFNSVENLPPLSPRFVYLLQERFVREFTR